MIDRTDGLSLSVDIDGFAQRCARGSTLGRAHGRRHASRLSIPHVPRSASELAALITDGVLIEGQAFDAKALIDAGDKANGRLAIDLAAMSVAGGMIAIGIKDVGGRLHPSPIALAGLKERVSQVGLSRVDSPVFTTSIELFGEDGSTGYLVVLVPPSPDAPHQVDGRYRGRGDTTNYVMGDAEVKRVQATRRQTRTDIRTELALAVDRDPATVERRNAHLFVVARPSVVTSPTMLQDRLGRRWQHWFLEQLLPAVARTEFSPNVGPNRQLYRRPDGWAATGGPIGPTRKIEERETWYEGGLIELEVDEDGSLRLFCGRASDYKMSSDVRWAIEEVITGLTWSVLRAAAVIADTTDHFGNWEFAVAITHAEGMASHAASANWRDPYPFGAEDYRTMTVGTYAEITEHRQQVIERLLGRLNRALNDDSVPLTDFDAAR